MDWETFFMSLVYLIGMKSKDESTHLGAVIVSQDNTIISVGYNGIARGVEYNEERQQRPEKYFWMEHAERNAIYNAVRTGANLTNATMYTNGTPCCDCARAVIQSGLYAVIVDKSWDSKNKGKWLEHANRSRQMFRESGVGLGQWDGEIVREIEKFRRGKLI